MAIDTLQKLGERVCSEEFLNFSPTSNSTKPPHIANGLFRACMGEVCDTSDIHEWVGKKDTVPAPGKNDSILSETIIENYQGILERSNNENPAHIRDFRFLLHEIFDQDNSVYPSYEFSVMSISSHWMIKKKVNSEANIGDFLFEILSKKIGGKRSPAIELIKAALSNDNDDMTKLVKPIIAFPSDKEKRDSFGVDFPDDNDIHWDDCKAKIRKGFDCLTENMKYVGDDKNSLLVLRRYVNYGVFATLLYLMNANCALYGGVHPPIVIDSGAELDSIRKASEQSFSCGKKAVEDYFINSIYRCIDGEIISSSKQECEKWIDGMSFSTIKREDDVKPAIKSYFNSFCEEEKDPKYALARALQIALYTFEYKSNSPSDFCRVLGVRSGLVGPKGNRAKIKRYLINSFTLETITLSVMSKDELDCGLDLKDLSEKLLNDYCILIGGNSEKEFSILEDMNIAQSTPGDLRGDLSINVQHLANTYISLGLGKRYADGVTLIGWRL